MGINEERLQIESIRRGFAEMAAGHYIPHEAMKGWLLSVGSDHELPPPKCVCGESHNEPSEAERRNGGGPLGPRVAKSQLEIIEVGGTEVRTIKACQQRIRDLR